LVIGTIGALDRAVRKCLFKGPEVAAKLRATSFAPRQSCWRSSQDWQAKLPPLARNSNPSPTLGGALRTVEAN